MKNYFQTWMYVSRISRRCKIAGKIIQFLCGIRGHELSKTEWGYGGGDYADCWCRWCNKMISVPKTSLYFTNPDSRDLMKMVEKR